MKFNTIESVWAYAKKKCPSGVVITTVKKMSGGLKAFDITIPKSKVTKWPVDVKDEDLEYTISSDMSGLFAFLELNNSDLELDDSSDFAEFILSTMGLKESLNESDQTWFKIDNHNYDKYGIQQDAYTTMVRLTGENSFMFANRYNQQNKESISVGSLMQSVEGSKCIKSTFTNTTSVMIYTLKDGILVVEHGQSKFDEKVYVSNKVYKSLNVNESLNENAIICITDSSNNTWDKEICFTYYGTRADLDKQLAKLKKPYLLEVMPGDEATLHCKNNDINVFKGYVSALKESLNEAKTMLIDEKFIYAYSSEFAMIGGYLGYRPEKCYYIDSEKHKELYKTITDKLGKIDIDINIKKHIGGRYMIQIYNSISIAHFSAQGAFSGYVISPANKLKLALNESEHMQTTGKLFYTAEEIGVLSDEAIKTALETLSGQMSELSTDPAEDSIKAYKEHENTYIDLKSELEKRGLK